MGNSHYHLILEDSGLKVYPSNGRVPPNVIYGATADWAALADGDSSKLRAIGDAELTAEVLLILSGREPAMAIEEQAAA